MRTGGGRPLQVTAPVAGGLEPNGACVSFSLHPYIKNLWGPRALRSIRLSPPRVQTTAVPRAADARGGRTMDENTLGAKTSALPSVEILVQRRKARDGSGRSSSSSSSILSQSQPERKDRNESSVRKLPGIIQHTPKVLVLDLDETLIHSRLGSASVWNTWNVRDHVGTRITDAVMNIVGLGSGIPSHARLQIRGIEVHIDGRRVFYQVYKRPWVDYFLRKVASWYHVVIFTASMKEYADPVIDWLDGGQGLISGRLFRDSCTLRNGSYLKDLEIVEEDLSRVCLVDNSPISYLLQEANGIPVEGWTHDPNDEALLDLLPILDGLRYASDVRHILGLRGF